MKPHVEKKMCKNFEHWSSKRNFCSAYKNSETSPKKSRKAVFKPGQNIMSLLKWIIQIPPPFQPIDTPNFCLDFWNFF